MLRTPAYIGRHRPETVERLCQNGHKLPAGQSWCYTCEGGAALTRTKELATSS